LHIYPARMRLRTLGTIGIALLVLMVGLAAALVAVVSTIDVNRYKGVIAQKVSEATGRTLEIRGDLRLTLFSLVPAIRVEGVSLANAPWGSAPRMVRVKRLDAQVALLPLLQRQVRVKRLVLVEPEILLETDAKGRRNWDLFPEKRSGAPAPGNGGVPAFHVREVRVKDGRLTYRDGASGRTTTVRIDRLPGQERVDAITLDPWQLDVADREAFDVVEVQQLVDPVHQQGLRALAPGPNLPALGG